MSDNNKNGTHAPDYEEGNVSYDPTDNEVTIHESTVPFVITYRRVYERPKVEQWVEFRGWGKGLKRMADKVKATIHDCFYEEKQKMISPGRSQAVHWAINVADPFDAAGEQELVAKNYGTDKPPAAVNFHVIQMVDQENAQRWQDTRHVEHPAYRPQSVAPLSPEADKRTPSEKRAADRIRSSMRQERDENAA